MKVLYVSFGLGVYGANTSLLTMIHALREKYGIEPTVLIRAEREFAARLDEHRIRYLCLPWDSWVHPKLTPFKRFAVVVRNALWNRVRYQNVLAAIREKGWDFDLIHTNTSIVNIGAYLSRELEVPHVWHIREFGEEDFNLVFNRGLYLAGRYMAKHSDVLVANSKAVKDKFSRLVGGNSIQVIYNPVDLEKNVCRRDFSRLLEKEEVSFLFAGLVHRNKNQLEVLRAANLLKNTMNVHNFKIYFAGHGDEKYLSKLKSYVIKNGLESYAEFLGYVPDLHKLREKMDVALVCSKMEAFGRVTAEAMLSQMPVIGTNTGGTPEIIAHDKTGYLYDLGDIDQLASYMKEFIENRDLIRSFGLNGYAKAKKHYAPDLHAEKIYSLYRQTVSKTTVNLRT